MNLRFTDREDDIGLTQSVQIVGGWVVARKPIENNAGQENNAWVDLFYYLQVLIPPIKSDMTKLHVPTPPFVFL